MRGPRPPSGRGRRQTAGRIFRRGEKRDLAVHERRREPPRIVRLQARGESLRRPQHRADAVRRGAEPGAHRDEQPRRRGQRRQRPAAQRPLSAAGRLQAARPKRHLRERLVPAHGPLDRRHRRRALAVDHRQQPRRPDAVPLRPAHARRANTPTSARGCSYGLGSLNDNLPQYISIGNREYWNDRDGHYLGPAHDAVPLRLDPSHPLDYARPESPLNPAAQQIGFDLVGQLNQASAAALSR